MSDVTREVLLDMFKTEKLGIDIRNKKIALQKKDQEAKIEEQKGLPLKANKIRKEMEPMEAELEKLMEQQKPAEELLDGWIKKLESKK
jgi:hypothetical protein